MSRATSKMREFAKHLIACETGKRKPAETRIPAAFVVCDKLRSHLGILLGKAGFHALLVRAFALASAEVPGLGAVKLQADGTFEGLEEHGPKIPEGGLVLLAHLVGLLTTFIGHDLTLRLVREVWPKLSIGDMESWR